MSARYVLNSDQKEALNLLSGMTSVSALQDRERTLVAKLLADCMLDTALNAAVRDHMRKTPLAVQPHVDVFSIAFHARQWEKFNTVYTQFTRDFASISREEKLTDTQPLRNVLSNYALIRSAAHLRGDFDRMHEKGLVSNHPELLELHEKIKICSDMIEVLDKKFTASASAKPGLFAHDERAGLLNYYQSLATTFNASDKPDQRYRPK